MTRGSNSGGAKRFILQYVQTHTASYSKGYRGSFPGQKRLGHEVDSSSPASAEVKNEWRYTSTPHIRLNGMDRKDLPFLLLHNFSLNVTANLK